MRLKNCSLPIWKSDIYFYWFYNWVSWDNLIIYMQNKIPNLSGMKFQNIFAETSLTSSSPKFSSWCPPCGSLSLSLARAGSPEAWPSFSPSLFFSGAFSGLCTGGTQQALLLDCLVNPQHCRIYPSSSRLPDLGVLFEDWRGSALAKDKSQHPLVLSSVGLVAGHDSCCISPVKLPNYFPATNDAAIFTHQPACALKRFASSTSLRYIVWFIFYYRRFYVNKTIFYIKWERKTLFFFFHLLFCWMTEAAAGVGFSLYGCFVGKASIIVWKPSKLLFDWVISFQLSNA